MTRWALRKLASPHGNGTVGGGNPWTWAQFGALRQETLMIYGPSHPQARGGDQ